MRTLCVWFPRWSLGRPDAPAEGPVIVVGSGVDATVVAYSAGVEGIEVGMSRREAETSCPGATVLVRDIGEEMARFEPVASALEDLVPRVEVVEPGLVFMPLDGAVAYYGGEKMVVEAVGGKLMARGLDVRLGVADGPFAARWAARMAKAGEPVLVADSKEFLAALDVSTLGHDDLAAVFRWLGVMTLGDLAELPRDAIASRFGVSGLEVHRIAHGEDRMVSPRPIPPELAIESVFEAPLESMDQLAFAARSLASRLSVALRREGMAPFRIVVEIESAAGDIRERVWRSTNPFSEAALADRVWWQARAWLESGRIPGGVTRIRIDPSDLSGEGRQMGLFDDGASHLEAERALARAQALVGPDAVLQADPQGGRMPGERVAWRRWGEPGSAFERNPDAPWPGATPSPSPALVPPTPPPLDVEWEGGIPIRVRLASRWEPVIGWSGPWRLTGRWWRGEEAVDRYQLVTSAGAFLCVVTASMETFLAGVYD